MSSTPLPPILLVGCGRMGSALLQAWIDRGLADSCVVEPAPRPSLPCAANVQVFAEASRLPGDFAPRAVVFAIKPQQAEAAVHQYSQFAGRSVFLSIMAGRALDSLRAALGPRAAIVRAMPNTPAAIRRGMSVLFAGNEVSPRERDLCGSLLSAVGEIAWVSDERMLDPVTAISGSGPAYVFLLAELLEKAGVEQGMPESLARLLARRTVFGAGALLEASDEDASALRAAVTSPGGTTERALAILMRNDAWPTAVSAAVTAATRRSRELAR